MEDAMRLFQITEDDLAELERTLPDLFSSGPVMQALDNNRSRTQLRRVKDILSNVRWNYGPWSDVTIVPADGPLPEGES
jgi:hypothetical protein